MLKTAKNDFSFIEIYSTVIVKNYNLIMFSWVFEK